MRVSTAKTFLLQVKLQVRKFGPKQNGKPKAQPLETREGLGRLEGQGLRHPPKFHSITNDMSLWPLINIYVISELV